MPLANQVTGELKDDINTGSVLGKRKGPNMRVVQADVSKETAQKARKGKKPPEEQESDSDRVKRILKSGNITQVREELARLGWRYDTAKREDPVRWLAKPQGSLRKPDYVQLLTEYATKLGLI